LDYYPINFYFIFKMQSHQTFPRGNYLVYIPNNYHVWVKTLMDFGAHDYGALATAVLDESKINFNYIVSDLPPSLLQSQGVSLSMHSSPHGGEDEETDLKKGSQSAPPPASARVPHGGEDEETDLKKGSQSAPPPASARVPTPLPKVTSRMVMQQYSRQGVW
jgi:hypothetical protein